MMLKRNDILLAKDLKSFFIIASSPSRNNFYGTQYSISFEMLSDYQMYEFDSYDYILTAWYHISKDFNKDEIVNYINQIKTLGIFQ